MYVFVVILEVCVEECCLFDFVACVDCGVFGVDELLYDVGVVFA